MPENQTPGQEPTVEDLPDRAESVTPSDAAETKGGVSAYIGETEKNINTVFRPAKPTDATLSFDEGDSLFKR